MKQLESLKKSTFDSFKDYKINNLAACTGGAINTYHGGVANDVFNPGTPGTWSMGGTRGDYSVNGVSQN